MMRGFEGGQMPLHRRLPKRGFTNIFRTEYTVVNVEQLGKLGEKNITLETLKSAGLVNGKNPLVKVLGNGELTSATRFRHTSFPSPRRRRSPKRAAKQKFYNGEGPGIPGPNRWG